MCESTEVHHLLIVALKLVQLKNNVKLIHPRNIMEIWHELIFASQLPGTTCFSGQHLDNLKQGQVLEKVN
jgi:hypothetical protein